MRESGDHRYTSTKNFHSVAQCQTKNAAWNAGSLKTIVMGSSHGDYGFNPHYCELSFNLCCRSQDLKHSFHLYKHVNAIAPNLKNLVLFYSIFSPGNRMENSPGEKDICPAINEIFELGLDYQDEHLATLSDNIRGHLVRFEFDVEGHAGFFLLPRNSFSQKTMAYSNVRMSI